jgi:hypothetical protein
MTRVKLVCAALLFAAAAACGGSAPADTSSTPAASGSASATSATTSSKVVAHEQLQALLPQVEGWTRGEPRGETDTTEAVSRVQASYERRDNGGLSVEIMDTARNQAMLEPMLAMIKSGYKSNQGGTVTKATTVGGFPGYEEWTSESKNGSVSVLVEGRFTVAVTGSFVPDLATLRKVADSIDLKKLAALK